MANTVNDVMNVIANPDYGIKNIAGTNQEILAIMQGTHNSKNNIYSLVNDVKNLLQELVGTSTKNKPVEVNGTSTKINQRHIQDILDETKGIRKAIENLSKVLLKQKNTPMPTIAKLSDRASEKVANAMVESMDKQNRGSGLTPIIDAFSKLKNISLKDITFGWLKINLIKKAFKDAGKDLNINKKDFKNIIKLIKAAPEIIESLLKINWGINKIIKKNTINVLSDILIGEKNSILSLSILLNKNKKDFGDASKVSKKITILTGDLFATSIRLAVIAITGKIAEIGTKRLLNIINGIINISTILSINSKQIKKSVKSARELNDFVKLMAVTSLSLSIIAVSGIAALVGVLFMSGIIKACTLTFEMLKTSKKNIAIGSISMILMTSSLILFGIALGKITKATKGVSFKQVGVIASLTVSLALAVAGIGFFSIPIGVGSIAVGVMSIALHKFAKTLKTISGIGTVPTKLVYQTLNSLKAVANFFKNNSLNLKAIKTANRYIKILRPFGNTIKHLSKLKELGIIPMKLVYQTLGAIKTIANYYIENPIRKKAIKQAKRYKDILKPFGKTIKHLSKLKELGVLPMKLVYQTLNAIRTIANYYIENPIRKKAIKQAKRYKDILKPFGKTIKHLTKLKELGVIPMKLVYQTLNTIGTIANYYIENPIRKKAIKQAKRYKDILKPFGKTIKHLSKLKELGVLPMKLVYQTLNTISTIANYYIENPIRKKAIKQAKRYKDILKPFGKSIQHISKLKELSDIPINTVNKAVIAMKTITEFLKHDSLNGIQRKRAIKNMSMLNDITSLMTNIFNINNSNISSIGDAMSNALGGVNTVDISKVKAVTNMFNAFNEINKSENVINKFTESVKDFTESCKNLMNAMSDNTDAINNIDGVGLNGSNVREIRETNFIEKSHNGDVTQNSGIIIANVDELARTIAEKINGVLSVDIPDTQVQLLINGTGGNEWTISRY